MDNLNTAAPEKLDLDKVRDDICFPIVRNIFKEFPDGLIVDDEMQKQLQLKALSAMLSADLNIVQEVAYVPQLMLGILAGLNLTVQLTNPVNDEERYQEIARKMLKFIVEDIDNIPLGTVTPEEIAKAFQGVKLKLDKLFFEEENLSRIEVKYVMDLIFTHFNTFNNEISSSITKSTEKMEAKILGIESMSDLTLKKLNEELIK